MIDAIRNRLRSSMHWVRLRELQMEGFLQAWRRWRIQKKILHTKPVETATEGSLEVRAVTWRRDWVNVIWALKSFYHHAAVRLPLHIHDGGLLPGQAARLTRHFPNAQIIEASEADKIVCAELERRGMRRCLAYRRKNAAARKIFDYAVFSKARRIISIDSDIVFFRRPDALLAVEDRISRFNRDIAYAYSVPQEEVNRICGASVPPLVNSGLFVVERDSINLELVEEWLSNDRLFNDVWVTEQTVHAMLATLWSVELLPPTYIVDTKAGLNAACICKHYPGTYRKLLYTEGMEAVAPDVIT